MSQKVTVVGVGMVGEQIISTLRERNLPVEWPPTVCATRARSEVLAGERFEVEVVTEKSFRDSTVALFAGKEGAKGASVQWRACAEAAGVLSIDNSSDFRMDPDVPLVIPEVNLDAVQPHHKFIASPNCSTIQLVLAVAPIHRAATVSRIIVSTYQSVSGWGVKAHQELLDQIPRALESPDSIPFDPTVMARPIVSNLLPHIDRFTEDGNTKEEMKMVHETHKILGDDGIGISATAVRVPVFVGHGESIHVQTEKKLSADDVREVLREAPGVKVVDDLSPSNPRNDEYERTYPTVEDLQRPEYKDYVLVGRIREDEAVENGINLWCVADNLRKGAALNVVQIWEALLRRDGIV